MVGEKVENLDSAAERLGIKKKSVEDDYKLEDQLGVGGSGIVKLCYSKEGKGLLLACKTMPKVQNKLDRVYREIEIMRHLRGHPGIVGLEDVYEDSESFHLIMELVTGGDLFDYTVNKWPHSEKECASKIKELMIIINYCHDNGVVHRDIKLENVLLTHNGTVKLADFGLATKFIKGQSLTSMLGSPEYIAPEVLTGKYTEKVDVWGAGILLHGMLVGFTPFPGESVSAILWKVKNLKLSLSGKKWERISEAARDLLGGMLQRDPSLRLSAAEVLRHLWILLHTEEIPRSKYHAAGPFFEPGSLANSVAEMSQKTTGLSLHGNG